MTTQETISQLYNAMEWIESVAGASEKDAPHIVDMLYAIQQAINTLDEAQINGTVN